MRYLKTFESGFTHPVKKQIVNQVNQIIDDAILPLIDDGFEEVGIVGEGGSGYDIFRKYIRPNKKTMGIIQLNGEINDGVIDWSDDECLRYEHFDHDIVQEFLNALSLMNGVSGINIKFSFTNHYDKDKIIIYTNV